MEDKRKMSLVCPSKDFRRTVDDNPDHGALQGKKILLTCSSAIQQKAVDLVRDLGGHPVQFPLICLKRRRGILPRLTDFDWLVVTSPSSVRAFMQSVLEEKIDDRTIPKIMVCGRGTAAEFSDYGIRVDAQPEENFSTETLKELAKKTIKPGTKILRVRSDKAGSDLADALRKNGADVEDAVIYDNAPVIHDELPDFDVVFFASASGVESFILQWGVAALAGKNITVIGIPTKQALAVHNIEPDVVAKKATIHGAIQSLAEYFADQAFLK